MAKDVFLKHDVEISYTNASIGKSNKQVLPNLKEAATSEKMVELGQLFVELLPEGIEVGEIVTVKRTRHQKI